MQSVQPKYGWFMTAAAGLWLGLFPLLQGGTYAHLTRDKWSAMLVLCAVTLLCCLADSLRALPNRRKAPSRSVPAAAGVLPLALAGGLLAWTVLSCLLSDYGPEIWWIGRGARWEGLATQLCYFGLFFCFRFSRVHLKTVLAAAVTGLAAFLAVVLLQRADLNPLGLYPHGRSFALNPEFQGTIGNLDMDTGYLCLLAGFFLYLLLPSLPFGKKGRPAKGKRLSLTFLLSLAGLLAAVFLIVTMDVQFGIITLGVLFLFTLLRALPSRYRLAVLAAVLALALAAAWFWPGTGGGVWELHEILRGRARLSFGSNRVAVWKYSLGLARLRPLLGGGSATFPLRFRAYLQENGLAIPTEQAGVPLPDVFDTPHNEYLAQLTDHGLPALLLFVCLLLCAVFRRRKGAFPLLTPCSAPVLCYAVQAFFSFSVCLVAPMFWVLLGMAFSPAQEAAG